MTPPQPGTRARPGGPDDEGAIAAQMVERGAAGFAALAPAVAIPAMSLIEEGSAERMQRTLESLVRDYREHHRLGLAELVDQSIPERSDEQLALSLGLDEEAAAHVPLRGVVSARAEVLDRAAVLSLDRMPLVTEYGPRQAEFVALAVASALQPRVPIRSRTTCWMFPAGSRSRRSCSRSWSGTRTSSNDHAPQSVLASNVDTNRHRAGPLDRGA
jgi:hypothetical protein